MAAVPNTKLINAVTIPPTPAPNIAPAAPAAAVKAVLAFLRYLMNFLIAPQDFLNATPGFLTTL